MWKVRVWLTVESGLNLKRQNTLPLTFPKRLPLGFSFLIIVVVPFWKWSCYGFCVAWLCGEAVFSKWVYSFWWTGDISFYVLLAVLCGPLCSLKSYFSFLGMVFGLHFFSVIRICVVWLIFLMNQNYNLNIIFSLIIVLLGPITLKTNTHLAFKKYMKSCKIRLASPKLSN